jgi:hypothetical protein
MSWIKSMFTMIAGVAVYAINVFKLKDVLNKINVCGFQAIFRITTTNMPYVHRIYRSTNEIEKKLIGQTIVFFNLPSVNDHLQLTRSKLATTVHHRHLN